MRCPNCGRDVEENNKYCKYCGYSFDDVTLDNENSGITPNTNNAVLKKKNNIATVLIILAAGLVMSAAVIFIGYNVLRAQSLVNEAKKSTEKTEKVSSKKKKAAKKEKKVISEEEAAMIESSLEATVEEETLETAEYEYNEVEEGAPIEPAYNTMYVVNCNKSISLRAEPSTKATAIRQIPLGAAVSFIHNSSDGFYRVSYMGDTGYALASYLSNDPNSSYRPAQTAAASQNYSTMYVVNCKESISLRISPSTKAKSIRQIPLGAAVSFVHNSSDGFYRISYMGDTGYALASYLSSTPNVSYYDGDEDWHGQVINCKESITLREAPSTSAREVMQIPLYGVVTVYGWVNDDFCFVSYNGNYGYVLAEYLYIF